MKRSLVTLIISALVLCVLGCGIPTTAVPANMVPHQVSIENRHRGSVCIAIDEVEYDSISEKERFVGIPLAKAVDLTVAESGLFTEVVSCSAEPDFELRINVVHFGASTGWSVFHKTSGAVGVMWRLFRRGEDRPLWESEITTTSRICQMPADPRLRQAIEKAGRANVKRAMVELSQLALE